MSQKDPEIWLQRLCIEYDTQLTEYEQRTTDHLQAEIDHLKTEIWYLKIGLGLSFVFGLALRKWS